ncbi:nucleoporin NUP42 [Manduca sexta]|uniref:Nucleoporin NUP42 n=1 Tax=Manduca sexta TaxID=7130 RepID=A0A922CMT0_MANSE|nr:nucleoporin NUP42 [Manduca sexta]KAG6451128.1 hypothetical protein O3G_MSEX006955 [Manduca sexta]
MVVCKFFQQGYCRYGQSCRFEHIYGSKYSYHANPPPQQQSQQNVVTDEQLLNQVQSDVLAALKGGMWILTCYAPFKEKPIIPGLHDLSPEEARLFIYEAKASNNIDNAISYINNHLKETRDKYEQLLKATPTVTNLLRSLYQGETIASPFTSNQNTGFGNPATSIFRSAVQNTPFQNASPSIFNQAPNTSMFASQTEAKDLFAQAANQNVFQQSQSMFPSQDTAKSIFAQATQNIFSPNTQSIFNTNQVSNQSAGIFATANQNVFGKLDNAQQNSTFPQAPVNVFQKSENPPSNVFSQNVFSTNESGVYSKMEELSAQDLEAFNSLSFKLGFIPEIAPPRELCN